ncbi:hypothetical protein CCAND38_680006 [Capnocytophaga canis]|uniref:Uncharacterized protein n=1 Tax=Capnocytophaga canis TaxID=1848903 RepID=A0A0B7IDQ9_9FLAO|nr:hypothetical protein CCAND38_680006 [Capnocytophaga canis]
MCNERQVFYPIGNPFPNFGKLSRLQRIPIMNAVNIGRPLAVKIGDWFYQLVKFTYNLGVFYKNQPHTTYATSVLISCFKINGNK